MSLWLYANRNADTDGYCHCDSDANRDCHANRDADSNRNHDSDSYTYSNTNANCYTNADRNPESCSHTENSPYSSAAPDSVGLCVSQDFAFQALLEDCTALVSSIAPQILSATSSSRISRTVSGLISRPPLRRKRSISNRA